MAINEDIEGLKKMSCAICDLIASQRCKYYVSDDFIVTECPECERPLIALRKHGQQPKLKDYKKAVQIGRLIYKRKFKGLHMPHRIAKNHWHAHIIIRGKFR